MATMRKFALLLLIVAGVGTGCGPTKSTAAILSVRAAIKRAEAADAEKHAPYELALAREYYDKAREEAGYSQYEVSEKLAAKALEYAKIAAGEPVATPPPTAVNPDEEMP